MKMKVRGPQGMIYVRGNNPIISTKWFVEDADRNLLFETEKSSDVAVQWAIDYQANKNHSLRKRVNKNE